jgi:DNA-binding transcriptional LysR family regulator
MQCDNPLIQMQAARKGIGIAELACFLGDQSELVRVWPSEPPLLRPVWLLAHQTCAVQRVSNSPLPQSWMRSTAMPRLCATSALTSQAAQRPRRRTD